MVFQKFDVSGYRANWQENFLWDLYKSKAKCWDVRRPDQLIRLQSVANGIKQWLDTLPDEFEVGTTDLVRQLIPMRWEKGDRDFIMFTIRRVERCRYSRLLNGYFYSVPNPRSKRGHNFYKFHKQRTPAP